VSEHTFKFDPNFGSNPSRYKFSQISPLATLNFAQIPRQNTTAASIWNTLQSRVQGRSHIANGTPCQDATHIIADGDFCALALSDGAGSAKLSHFGSRAISAKICEILRENFDDYFACDDALKVKQDILVKCLATLNDLAASHACEIKELACTLLAVAAKGGNFIIAHIGDGVIGYLKDGELKVASDPENGEFANTTIFVTSKNALPTMKLIKGALGDIRAFFAMSDGTAAGLYAKRERKFGKAILRHIYLSAFDAALAQSSLDALIASQVRAKTTDDCSLAIMSLGAAFGGYFALSAAERKWLIGCRSTRRLGVYDAILRLCATPQSRSAIDALFLAFPRPRVRKTLGYYLARLFAPRRDYPARYISRLLALGLLRHDGARYRTQIPL